MGARCWYVPFVRRSCSCPVLYDKRWRYVPLTHKASEQKTPLALMRAGTRIGRPEIYLPAGTRRKRGDRFGKVAIELRQMVVAENINIVCPLASRSREGKEGELEVGKISFILTYPPPEPPPPPSRE